jgi:hypothetical protein
LKLGKIKGSLNAGAGASHQTGWTGLVAKLIELFGRLEPAKYLEAGKRGAYLCWLVKTMIPARGRDPRGIRRRRNQDEGGESNKGKVPISLWRENTYQNDCREISKRTKEAV